VILIIKRVSGWFLIFGVVAAYEYLLTISIDSAGEGAPRKIRLFYAAHFFSRP
jgi:hypothetical protein